MDPTSPSVPEITDLQPNGAEASQLQDILRRRIRRQPADRTLEGSALLKELIIHLCSGAHQTVQSPAQLMAAASGALRRVLVEHAKNPDPDKGGDSCRVRLAGATMTQPCELDHIIALDEQLEKLAGQDPRMARVVELRYFGGMSNAEVADVLGLQETTVQRDWRLARAWLYAQLRGDRLHRKDADAG